MSKSKWLKVFSRSSSKSHDSASVDNSVYNEAAGGNKVIVIQPDIKGLYVANSPIGAGKLIKIAVAGTYDLVMAGKAFSAATAYKKGSVVVNTGSVYVCDIAESEKAFGAFDPEQWTKVAPATIAGIPNAAGDVISTGRWHNSISVAGFIVEDDTNIGLSRVQ